MANEKSFRADRRRFLELVVASAGSVLATAACSTADCECAAPSDDSDQFFPQSVASGDPRPTTVVLWTRVTDWLRSGEDLEVELEVARDEGFSELVTLDGGARLRVVASAAADGCIKVRLTELNPGTTYYYRFIYAPPAGHPTPVMTRVGRTRTAPADEADVPVRFAAMSCQDYDQKQFYAYDHLLTQEVDFVVHLGDYVYEGGVPKMADGGHRQVVFGRPDEALGIGDDGGPPLVAWSLDNYRDLYRTVRSDSALQRAHERFPFIVIPDDHEFANDSHGATATYQDGRSDETDVERRRNADQAWFEYMPVDYTHEPAKELANGRFPDDFAIYRGFGFGRHLELVMTDLRRYRPDHVIAEDAFPGALLLNAAEVEEDEVPTELTVPYVDIDEYADGAYRVALRDAAEALGFRAGSVSGELSAAWINAQLELIGDGSPVPVDLDDPELPRGVAVHQVLKDEEFSSVGSRYFIGLDAFEAYAARRFRETEGASERVMGSEQRAWFLETMRSSERTFKVWGSEIALLPKHLDLRGFTAAPPELRMRIGLTAEDWDGFPNERRELLAELGAIDNVVVLSGDLHCFFAATPFLAEQPERSVVEFTIGSVSSTTWLTAIRSLVDSYASLPPSVAMLAPLVGGLLASKKPPANPHLAFQELAKNGYAIIHVGADALEAELFMIEPQSVATVFDSRAFDIGRLFTSVVFRVPAGSSALERRTAAGHERWSAAELAWISS